MKEAKKSRNKRKKEIERLNVSLPVIGVRTHVSALSLGDSHGVDDGLFIGAHAVELVADEERVVVADLETIYARVRSGQRGCL